VSRGPGTRAYPGAPGSEFRGALNAVSDFASCTFQDGRGAMTAMSDSSRILKPRREDALYKMSFDPMRRRSDGSQTRA
jgi:hypothetical protein